MSEKLSDREAMRLAILSAGKGQGFVSPNPPVGCVILDKNQHLLSTGFYSHYGGIHAEISALNKIKDKKSLKGGRLFVTLEPCAHFGQNPPCADQLTKYPLSAVIYGQEDPNPLTKSKGIKRLRQKKGLLVKKSPFFQKSIRRLYEAFTLNMKENRTFFALKMASSLDGVLSLTHGESQWITNKKSRAFALNMRKNYTAILIGLNTFLEDNPRLNYRGKGPKRANKVCLLDPSGKSLKLIPQSRLASVRSLKDIFVITSPSAPKNKGPVKTIISPFLPNRRQFDLKALSKQLYKEKISSVLVEGGGHTISSFLEQNVAKRLYYFISPCLIGGKKGKYWTENLSLPSLSKKKQLKFKENLFFDEDIFITGILD